MDDSTSSPGRKRELKLLAVGGSTAVTQDIPAHFKNNTGVIKTPRI